MFVQCDVASIITQDPKDMSGDFSLRGKCEFFFFFDSTGRGSVATCIESMVLASNSLSSMVCVHITGAIFGVAILAKCMFAPESAIAKLSLVRKFDWVSMLYVILNFR